MIEETKIRYFRTHLLKWFDKNKRNFPWRKENISNYEIILSEILLQRTKAETVANYYEIFFKKYPNWEELSNATLDELKNILKPLGLYNHRAKRIMNIIDEYKLKHGSLPKNKNELNDSNLSTLYISNAYELFVLNNRAPLLDVNMARLVSRFFEPKVIKDVRNDKEIYKLSKQITNVKRCKELNWAILDFAAIICKAKKPECEMCILKSRCIFVR